MQTILVTAYAVNPYKGSEDGMGWNFILQIARYQRVIAVTRANNKPAIDRYWAEHPELDECRQRITFLYFDWPYWLRLWKKGPFLSLIYYYGWQVSLAFWLRRQQLSVDLVHNLNFHNDWTPTFLWILGKPLVWGPVGHHPAIPKTALREYGWQVRLLDRSLWLLKRAFWQLDPFLHLTKRKATHILCMNPSAASVLGVPGYQYSLMPSVAAEAVPAFRPASECFRVLSVGRFVPLKGFTSTVRAFALFYHQLAPDQQRQVGLTLVGSGPDEKRIRQLVNEQGIGHCTVIIDWLPREDLPRCYQSASAFLFPSHEGAGMVVAEAMSYGLPVICWDNDGPGQFVPPDSGLRVPLSDLMVGEWQMARRLSDLFQSSALYQHERQLALQRFKNDFCWLARGDQLKKIYEAAL